MPPNMPPSQQRRSPRMHLLSSSAILVPAAMSLDDDSHRPTTAASIRLLDFLHRTPYPVHHYSSASASASSIPDYMDYSPSFSNLQSTISYLLSNISYLNSLIFFTTNLICSSLIHGLIDRLSSQSAIISVIGNLNCGTFHPPQGSQTIFNFWEERAHPSNYCMNGVYAHLRR